jgi:hypothetical protein
MRDERPVRPPLLPHRRSCAPAVVRRREPPPELLHGPPLANDAAYCSGE